MTKLGSAMATALGRIAVILRAGQTAGVFDVADADYLANHLYTQTLGAMHMARMGLIVSGDTPGHPVVHHADVATVRSTAITATLATAVGYKALSATKAAPNAALKAPARSRRSTSRRSAGEST